MDKKSIILIALFFSLSFAYATISSGDAINFVEQENNFLYGNEKTEIIKITHQETNYWVVRVYLEEAPATFIAVKTTAKELVTNKPVNRELFRTADLVWEFTNLKNNYSAERREWVITSDNSSFFQGLGRFLNDETFDLDTINSQLNDSAATLHINSMNSMLVSMSLKATGIREEINEALALESSFTLGPDTAQREELKEEFDDVFTLLDDLDSEAIDYRTEVSELKQIIANSNLEVTDKTFLISLADPPQEFNSIGNYKQAAVSLRGSIDAIYAIVAARIDALLDEFGKRIKRNQAYEILYGENPSLSQRTEGEFTILRPAADYIFDNDNFPDRPYWKNRGRLEKLENNWGRAQKYFNERNYDLAIEYGNKAVDDVALIYRDGFIDIDQEPIISTELIIQIVIILIILLVLIYMWNKREKIKELIKWRDVEEEVKLGEWEEEI